MQALSGQFRELMRKRGAGVPNSGILRAAFGTSIDGRLHSVAIILSCRRLQSPRVSDCRDFTPSLNDPSANFRV